MLITFFRAIVLYILVLVVMRLMGKREIGQMQPFELAAKYNVEALSILTISDHVFRGEETSPEERQNTFTDMMEVALQLIK